MVLTYVVASLALVAGVIVFCVPGSFSFIGAVMVIAGSWTLGSKLTALWLTGGWAVLAGLAVAAAVGAATLMLAITLDTTQYEHPRP